MERNGSIMNIFTSLSRPACALVALLALGPSARPADAQTFSEPATIFYGKVIGVGSAHPFIINEGALQWTIQRADGVEVVLSTSLFSFEDGTLSYRLDVPHSAFALGLTSPAGGVPLPPTPQTHLHKLVTVDGAVATLLGPASSAFTTEQLLRTATYRMDLAVDRVAADTDGDGIADWWEDKFGLDKQDPTDANRDVNGDGVTALQAYLQGLDPNHDYRSPELLTDEVVVYPAGTTALLLDVKDVDSAASNLVYTLTTLPNAGTLTLRNAHQNPSSPDEELGVGGQFTQTDLARGRVVYTHDGSAAQPGFFTVELRDGNPASAVYTGVVQLLAYEPPDLLPDELPASEEQRIDNHLNASAGRIVWDAGALATNCNLATPSAGLDATSLPAYVALYGDDRSYALADGAGNDTLRAGQQADILYVGAGNDVIAGGADADRFVFKSFAAGRKIIEDFTVADQDVIDFSRMPVAADAFVHQYLRVALSSGVYRLQVDLDGDGIGFTNLVVELPGLSASDADIYSLIESGRLLVGSLTLEPSVTVAATISQASENGPSDGVFTLTRRGSLEGDLQVNVTLAGSAQNGVDYSTVGSLVTIPSGQSTATVAIHPFADSVTESAETVELVVQPGNGYRVGSSDRATVTIEDLLMLVEIEAIEPLAVKDTLSPAAFLITRRDVINRDVVVRLNIGGTASNGSDYNSISTVLLMPANNTAAMIYITPKATANLAGGMETVVLSVKPDAAYRVSGNATAQVAIVERIDSFDAWRSREVPGGAGDMAEFAKTAPDDSGVSYLERYAFGLGADAQDQSGLPHPFMYDGRLAVTFKKPLGVSDVIYRVSAGTRLTDWAGSPIPVVEIPAPDGQSDPQRVYYSVGAAADSSDTIFTMVEIEWVH